MWLLGWFTRIAIGSALALLLFVSLEKVLDPSLRYVLVSAVAIIIVFSGARRRSGTRRFSG